MECSHLEENAMITPANIHVEAASRRCSGWLPKKHILNFNRISCLFRHINEMDYISHISGKLFVHISLFCFLVVLYENALSGWYGCDRNAGSAQKIMDLALT